MAVRQCRICRSSGEAAETFAAVGSFRCGDCGTVQSEVLPTSRELSAHYASYSETYTAGMGARRFAREMPKRHAAKLRLVEGFCPRGKLLDIGVAEGGFLSLAEAAGYEAIGCDYSLRREYPPGVKVVAGMVDEPGGLPFEDAHFDVVTLWAVIEHLRQPQVALAEIHRVLRTGGFLFIDTPLVGDSSERLAAARSHWICPPEHIHVLSQKAARLLINEAGFRILYAVPSFERNAWRWWARRLRNVLVGTVAGGLLKAVAGPIWRSARQRRVTPIGDIQLLAAEKPRS